MSSSHRPSLVLAILAFLVLPIGAPAKADTSPVGDPPRPWTIDDLLLSQSLGDVALSDDGRLAAWVVVSWQKKDDEYQRVGHAWLARFEDGQEAEPIQLTRGWDRPGDLAFSPDGSHLAFLSSREQPGEKKVKGSQVWVQSLAGGEPWALTRGERGARSLAWIDDEHLLISREEAPDARERAIEKKKDTSQAVEDVRDAPPVRLFVVGLDGKTKRLGENDDWIEQVSVAPDGQRAVITAGRSLSYSFDAKVPPRTFLVDLESGERNEILADTKLLPRSFAWTADSKSFYFIDDFSNHPIYRSATVAHLHRFDLDGDGTGGTARRVEHGWERGIARGFEVVPGGGVALLADGARYRLARLAVEESGTLRAERKELGGTHAEHLDRLWVARDGSRVLYLTSTGDRSPQLHAATLGAKALEGEQRLGHLNPGHEKLLSGRTEIVTWIGAEGDEVEGVLNYPFDYRQGERHPLILDIHGGPTGFDRNSWDASWASPTPLWRQRGAFVFRPNYHGSGNYGLEWAESIRERYYELEIPDIEKGVDMLIEKGLVDPDQLATTGWSNGGILSAGLITHTDRYKAAIIGAADVEWISDWANVAFGAAFDNYYFGGPPWERLEHYIEKSPFFDLPEVTTPSLVHTGTEDVNVPPHQSWSIFRVMQQVGKADVRLLTYPGEPHGLRQLVHQRRKVEEDLAWIDRHLFGTHEEPGFAVPEGSALAALLDRSRAARAAGAFGLPKDGHLLPEGVAFGNLVIGRFEVTRGQWRSFLDATGRSTGSAENAEGNPDLPATGMGFEEARAYAAWLAEITGEPWRLPTVAEAEALASRGGNTLDTWLGYAPNPDDLERVRERLRDAKINLLRPVGSHAGSPAEGNEDGPKVFDLDGNVAEWAVADDGSGKAVGPSAERPSDSDEAPGVDYTGLRVVRSP